MTPLTQSTIDAYDPAGTQAIYTATAPYVRNAASICPGVDLTAVPVVGRGALITSDVVARAYHNRGSVGSSYTFVDRDGASHVRTQVEIGPLIDEDLVLARLNQPLPATVTPWRIPPANLAAYCDNEQLYSFRVAYTGGHRLSLGGFDASKSIFRQTEIVANNAHWIEAVGGDSGGIYFMVVGNEPMALAPAKNLAEQGTAMYTHATVAAMMRFAPDLRVADLHLTQFNPSPPVLPPPADTSRIFINKPKR